VVAGGDVGAEVGVAVKGCAEGFVVVGPVVGICEGKLVGSGVG